MKNEEEYDDIVVICGNYLENVGLTIGKKEACFQCGQEVYMSDSSMNAIRKNHTAEHIAACPPKAMCIKCGMPELMDKDNDVILPTVEQVKEVIEGIRIVKSN